MENITTLTRKVRTARRVVKGHAKQSANFSDFVYDVKHDADLRQLVPMRVINILIQEQAPNLA